VRVRPALCVLNKASFFGYDGVFRLIGCSRGGPCSKIQSVSPRAFGYNTRSSDVSTVTVRQSCDELSAREHNAGINQRLLDRRWDDGSDATGFKGLMTLTDRRAESERGARRRARRRLLRDE